MDDISYFSLPLFAGDLDKMRFNFLSICRAVALLILIGFHLQLLLSKQINHYLNKHLIFLPYLTILFFLAFLIGDLRRIKEKIKPWEEMEEEEKNYYRLHIFGALLFLLPLLLYWLLPTTSLNVELLSDKVSTYSGYFSEELAKDFLSKKEGYTEENLLTVVSGIHKYPKLMKGKKVATIGFVWREKEEKNYFRLIRFLITCCAADATPLILRVEWEQTESLKNNQWVKVEGVITLDEKEKPYLKAVRVVKVPPPDEPYLYP